MNAVRILRVLGALALIAQIAVIFWIAATFG